jgi:hypothetical protein
MATKMEQGKTLKTRLRARELSKEKIIIGSQQVSNMVEMQFLNYYAKSSVQCDLWKEETES